MMVGCQVGCIELYICPKTSYMPAVLLGNISLLYALIPVTLRPMHQRL
ncbi:hypothetical protein GBAR_LOCUS22728 [Geodia barretti]|uniref:Uncharacterized protein n=1 Tax=Geodia barretti TaxID=519541 RepID=A0AA35T462_GEOBA|nr:hypothetical protein GBAR_LOCUS22728 [Geodia barretti]